MSDKKPQDKQQLNIAIDENVADGIYSNPVSYTHLTLPTNREV